MRQIVVAEYLSLDGVGEDPGRIGAFERRGWIVPYYDEELAAYMSDHLSAADALLLGRTTYEGFVTVWPARSGDPIGDRMNNLPKLVASTTLREPLDWNATLLAGDVTEEVQKLKEQPGHDLLVYGSGSLVHTLMQLDLIDTFQLMIAPVALGSGQRFFRDGHPPTTLSLTDIKSTGTGVVVLTYQRRPNDRDAFGSADELGGDWWLRRGRGANDQGPGA
jgi:dihydrofolate reductase